MLLPKIRLSVCTCREKVLTTHKAVNVNRFGSPYILRTYMLLDPTVSVTYSYTQRDILPQLARTQVPDRERLWLRHLLRQQTVLFPGRHSPTLAPTLGIF